MLNRLGPTLMTYSKPDFPKDKCPRCNHSIVAMIQLGGEESRPIFHCLKCKNLWTGPQEGDAKLPDVSWFDYRIYQ